MLKFHQSIAVALIGSLGLSACVTSSDRTLSTTQQGTLIGVIGGAAAGAAVASKSGKGALIGAIGGGLAGAAIGAYMDRHRQDLMQLLAPEIKNGSIHVAKYADNAILVTMTDSTAFDVGSYAIKGGFYPTLNRIADSVTRYGKTTLYITGHTDSTGTDRVNIPLSQNRAQAVSKYLSSQKVAAQRLSYAGMGSTQPRATNNNDAGRRLNRRVEILIQPVAE